MKIAYSRKDIGDNAEAGLYELVEKWQQQFGASFNTFCGDQQYLSCPVAGLQSRGRHPSECTYISCCICIVKLTSMLSNVQQSCHNITI